MKWYNPQNEPFKISGFPFYEKEHLYRRLPLSPKYPLPDAVNGLANETAGGQIRFHAKLKELYVEVSLASKPLFFAESASPHLAHISKAAFDLYVSRDGGEYVFYGVASDFTEKDSFYTERILKFEEEAEFDILLDFPLYGAVDKVLIGTDDDALISETRKPFEDDKKIVIYGTSIQQGGCAGRPGMVDSNILSRWLNREVYNLGFNSSGKGEPELAHIISEIKNTAVLIMSIEGNCPDKEWLDEKLREFIKIFRAVQPETPVIIMPFIVSGADFVNPARLKRRLEKRATQEKIVSDFRENGDKNIYLLPRDDYLEKEVSGHSILHEGTVDGIHYNDLGFFNTAKVLHDFLKEKIFK